MKRSYRYTVVAGLVGAVIALSGCTAPSNSGVSLPEKNETQWTLPLDEFTYSSSPLRDYAEALLERDCYAKQGIDWPVPWQPTDRGMGSSVSAGGQAILNLELAGTYGYHRAPIEYEGAAEWRTFVAETGKIADTTPGFTAVMDSCQAESRKALPLPSDDDRDYAIAAASQIFSEAVLAASVADAAQKWSQCMGDTGYGGLATSPDQMPPNDQSSMWGVGTPGTTPGPEEIAVATADVTCRTSSGWTTALYDEEWSKQADFVKSNSDRLVRIRDEFAKERKTLLDAVAENAPKHNG